MAEAERILLSVIVRVVGGTEHLRRCLSCLAPQAEGRAMEVIVPHVSMVAGMDHLKREFPRVVFLDAGVVLTDARPDTGGAAHEVFDRCTSRGLQMARGDILAILEDYCSPAPDWCKQVLEAHALPHAVIGGAVEHSGSGILNWAVYFLDFGRFQLPLPEGPVDYLTDVNLSYKRAALQSVKDLWITRYNEVRVNWALTRLGETLWQRPQMVVRQDRGRLELMAVIRERLCWGRVFGAVRAREVSASSRFLYIVLSPAIPIVLLERMARKVLNSRRHRKEFLLSFPLILVLTLFWSLGELMGYLTGRDAPVAKSHSSARTCQIRD